MAQRLNLRQITVIGAIVRQGSAARAASFLNISQPAVSKTIKLSEDLLGYCLFHRDGRQLVPTLEAMALMPRIERILNELTKLQGDAHAIGEGAFGQVSIAGNYSLISTVAVEAAILVRDNHPNVRANMEIRAPADVIREVINHKADIGLLYGEFPIDQLDGEEIGQWHCSVVFPAGHRLEARKVVTPLDLIEEQVMTYAAASPTGAAIQNAFEQHSLGYSPAITVSNTRTILDLIRRGQGIGIVDAFQPFVHDFTDLRARTFQPVIVNSAKLVVSKSHVPNGAVQGFMEAFRAIAPQFSICDG